MATSATSTTSTIVEQKRALRTRVRRQLRLQYPSLSNIEDPIIQNHVLNATWYKNSHRICAYISCPSIREVGTSLIISDIIQSTGPTKTLYVPWVEDKQSHMKFFHITSQEDLVANNMGILEPTPVDKNGIQREDVTQANEPIDLILLPGLAFDRDGRRLGRGGGYYDAFLRRYLQYAQERGWNPPLLVALAYSIQILDEAVPTDINDVPIHALVTSSGLLPISNDQRLNS